MFHAYPCEGGQRESEVEEAFVGDGEDYEDWGKG